MKWKEYIDMMKAKWIGKKIMYYGTVYAVTGIDYNGSILINRKTATNDTTAITETIAKAGLQED